MISSSIFGRPDICVRFASSSYTRGAHISVEIEAECGTDAFAIRLGRKIHEAIEVVIANSSDLETHD